MIDAYLTDTIDIITLAVDEWGVVTKTTTSNVKARIEDRNKLVKNKDGKEVVSNVFLIVDPEATLNYESRIKLVTKNGIAHPLAAKELAIIHMIKAGGFSVSHWEVSL